MSTANSWPSDASQLWGIYHTDREYARVNGDPLRIVVKATTKLAAENIAQRLGFSEPWAHPITAEQARQLRAAVGIKTDPRQTHPNMAAPSTAELRTAIHVLDKLAARLIAQTSHALLELPENQMDNHYAGKIESHSIEQITRLKHVSEQLKKWREELLQQRQTVFHHV